MSISKISSRRRLRQKFSYMSSDGQWYPSMWDTVPRAVQGAFLAGGVTPAAVVSGLIEDVTDTVNSMTPEGQAYLKSRSYEDVPYRSRRMAGARDRREKERLAQEVGYSSSTGRRLEPSTPAQGPPSGVGNKARSPK